VQLITTLQHISYQSQVRHPLKRHISYQSLQADRIGCLRTPHVLPVAGCHALDSGGPAQVCTNVEVFRVRGKQVTVVQQRAPVLAGHVRAYVKELCEWIAHVGFSRVIMLGGADASGRTDQQIVK
jgi:predicted ATP-grasp superfamily ATP-dependent carboligase